MSDSSQNNKRIAKNTVYLYINLLLSLFIGLYTSRAVLDALGVSDYGVYNVVAGFVALLSILTGNLRSASVRFITYELGKGDADKLRRTFATLNVESLLFASAVFIIGESFGPWLVSSYLDLPPDRVSTAQWVFQFALLSFMIDLWATPYSAVVNAHEHMRFFALMGILDAFAKLAIVFILYTTSYDRLIIYSVLMLLVSISIRLVWGLYCKKQFHEVRGGMLFDRNIFKEIFSYSVWVMLGTSSGVLKEQGVNIVINKFFGVLMNTPRGLAVQASGALGHFATNISAAISPQITKSYAEGNMMRSVTLTNTMIKAQSLMLMLLGIPLLLETDYVLSIWLKEVPEHTVIFLQWAIVLVFARTIHNAQGPLLLAIGKVKAAQICGGSIMLLNVPLAIIVLKIGCSAESTMIIGAFLEICAALNTAIFIKKYEPYSISNFFIKTILPLVLVVALTYSVAYIVQEFIPETSFLRCVFTIVVSSITLFGLSYVILLDHYEKKIIKDYIKKYR